MTPLRSALLFVLLFPTSSLPAQCTHDQRGNKNAGILVTDFTIDDYLAANQNLLPANFSRTNVQTIRNCPEALVHVRLLVDPTQDTSHIPPKDFPCKDQGKDSQ